MAIKKFDFLLVYSSEAISKADTVAQTNEKTSSRLKSVPARQEKA